MAIAALADSGIWAVAEPWFWGGAIAALAIAALVGSAEARGGRPPRASILVSAAASATIGLLGLLLVAGGPEFGAAAGRVLAFSPIHVRYDALSGLFLVALGTIGCAASIAAWDGLLHVPSSPLTGAAYPVFLLSMLLVFGSDEGFAFLLAWELMALSSAALVIGAAPVGEQVSAGYLYLAVTHLATAALLVAFALLAAAAGGSLAFADWATIAGRMPALQRDIVFGLFVVGFGTKAGAIPFHVWLPRAHPAAPSHVSALMSGVMIKTGIFGLVRLGLGVLGPGPDGWGLTLIAIGSISAVLGVLYALMEHDLKRLLAFHSIENIGIILLGLGAALLLAGHQLTAAAGIGLAAALFHSLNHGLFKGLLFLGAGAVQAAAGTRNLNRLGGLVRVMPATALAFGIGAAAISGLPPLNGFASEWLTFHALIGAGSASDLSPVARSVALLAIGGLALTAALALACFVKATGMTFLALPRSPGAAAARKASAPEQLGMGILAALCVGIGLAAGPVVARMSDLAARLLGGTGESPALGVTTLPDSSAGPGSVAPFALAVAALVAFGVAFLAGRSAGLGSTVRRAATWTCGIRPEAVLEYTASSYSKLIRLMFRGVLLPEREIHVEYHPDTPVPVAMHYTGEVTHVLEAHVFGPLHRLSVAAASRVRRLQNGSLQIYLGYALVALVVLLVFAR